MKKFLSVLLTTFMLLSAFPVISLSAQENVQLKLTDISVYAGDEFELKLFISDNSGLSGAVIDLNYDSDLLEYISAEEGAILDDSASINIKNFADKSFVRFTYMSPSSSVTSAGILLSVKFKANELAEGRTSVNISIPNAGDFVNSKLEKIPFEVVHSNVRIINSINTETETTDISSTDIVSESETNETESETISDISPNIDNNDNSEDIRIVVGLFATGFVLLSFVIIYVVVNKRKKR